MEITSLIKPQEIRQCNYNQSPTTSPHSSSIASSNESPHQIPTPPHTPNPITTSHHETNHIRYPTTFVQADTTSFKHVVQMLTGASKSHHPPPPPSSAIPPIKSTAQKKQGFKLYERRNSLKNGLMINTLVPGLMQNNTGRSPRKQHEMLSPSILDFPALVLSPVTPPLNGDSFREASAAAAALVEEEKSIAEKKFYFHPSPRTAAINAEPRLLSLFPVTLPTVSGSSN